MNHRVDILSRLEKTALRSKKFLAWLINQGCMVAMALVALIKQTEIGWPLSAFMVGVVFSMCVSTMWLLGKQAASDIAVRGFAFMASGDNAAGSRDSKVPPPVPPGV